MPPDQPTRTHSGFPTVAPVPEADCLIVIPTLNEARWIADCLRSLADDPHCELIVADGGSLDGTVDIVRHLQTEIPNLSLIHNPGRLQSAALNHVADHCLRPHHRVLIRCDAHALYPPGYARTLARTLRAREAASVVVPMDATGRTRFARAAAWVADTALGSGGAAHRGGQRSGWVEHGHHAAFDVAWFRRINGYDATFTHNEDAEFDLRLRRAGGRIWLAADIRLTYFMREAPSALARQYRNYGAGRARTLCKHRSHPQLRQMLPVLNLLMLPALLLAPTLPALLLWPGLYLGILLSASLLCALRTATVSGLWAGPAAGIMHVSWAVGFVWQVLAGRHQRRALQPTHCP